jgi:uncharacterized protein (UPF0276 family)
VSTLVEWDDDIPAWDVLALEASTARNAREEATRPPTLSEPQREGAVT